MAGRIALNALVGLLVGIVGGVVGLGGAELRLPYLVDVLGLSAHRAVPVNLAMMLGVLLIWSAWKVVAKDSGQPASASVNAS